MTLKKTFPRSFSFGTLIATLSLLCNFACTSGALADNETIRKADNAVWLSGGVDWFGYKESLPQGVIPDSERDGIASIGAGASWLGGIDEFQNIYAALDGSVSWGHATYSGAYLFAPNVPLKSTTDETISNLNGRLGIAFELNDHTMLIPYGEFGGRYWQRKLGPSQQEDYQNYQALAGAMLQVSPFSDLVLSGYGAVGETINSKMKTSGLTFNLGDEPVFKLGGKIGYDMTGDVEIFSTFDYEHFSYGRSSDVFGFYEPRSDTNEAALRVGLALHY